MIFPAPKLLGVGFFKYKFGAKCDIIYGVYKICEYHEVHIMKIFDLVVQGVVQGLTEFLPVSSSGHLLISQHILGVKDNNLFFNIILHIGTLLAVLAVYYKLVWELILACFSIVKKIFAKEFSFSELSDKEHMVVSLFFGLVPLFMLFLPVPWTGSNVKGIAEQLAGSNNIIIVGISLVATAILLNLGIHHKKSYKLSRSDSSLKKFNLEEIDRKQKVGIIDAIYIGVTQFAAAIFPGLSRSGSTLSTGLLRGIDKQTALDFSFVLGIPSIIAAALVECKDAVEAGAISSDGIVPMVIGMVVSAVVGFLSIKLFKWLLKTDKMQIFVRYTFSVGLICIIIDIIEKIRGFNIFTGIAI